MPLAPGRRLGPYEIVASLGAGGMGEVYEARDTRLGRTVAIKVLPEGLAESPERRARFEREARTVSQLTHPHVCTLHDVGEEEGIHFLVLEHCEGETLTQRLERGALSLEDTLRFGAEIAEALDAAHRRGVVHRDLKPANVMLTASGVKLLDFGLARLAAGDAGEVGDLPTMTIGAGRDLTEEGTVLGTFPYMSPEQVEGSEADARSDIFALGAVLYEMASGRRAFEGDSAASVMAAVLREEPQPLSKVQPLSPPVLDHVVSRCLAKDAEKRWQTARDVAEELRWVTEGGSQAGVVAPLAGRSKRRGRLAWGMVVMASVVAMGGLLWAFLAIRQQRFTVEEATRPFRTELVAPPGARIAFVAHGAIAISPGGTAIVMVARGEEGTGEEGTYLVVRDLSSGATRTLGGTEGATFPFWSPDSHWIGFFADGKLKRVETAGGAIQSLADAPEGRGGTWGSDGSIVFAPDTAGALAKIPDSGGAPSGVTKTEEMIRATHRNPHLLPGNRHVLYIAREEGERFGSIAVSSVEEPHETQILVEQGSNPQYADGFLFWVREGNLLARPFDPGSLELSGSPRPIARDVEYHNPRNIGNFSVSSGGTLAWKQASGVTHRVARFDLEGREIDTFGEAAFMLTRDFSRDGRKVLLRRLDGSTTGWDLWVMDLDRRQMTRATFSGAPWITGAFSPNAERIAVSSPSTGGGNELWIQSASGSGEKEQLLDSTGFRVQAWSPGGKTLVGIVQETATRSDIAYLAIDEPETLSPFVATPYEERGPRLSPDGEWIAYASTESGRWEIYASDFPAAKRKWQISTGDVLGPYSEWEYEGDAIYYLTGAGMVGVPVNRRGDRLDPGVPEILEFDITPIVGPRFLTDGETILMLAGDYATQEPIRIVRNWKRLLKQRMED